MSDALGHAPAMSSKRQSTAAPAASGGGSKRKKAGASSSSAGGSAPTFTFTFTYEDEEEPEEEEEEQEVGEWEKPEHSEPKPIGVYDDFYPGVHMCTAAIRANGQDLGTVRLLFCHSATQTTSLPTATQSLRTCR